MSGLIGKKIGMTSVYSAEGKNIPCTVIEAGPCVVTQIKTVEKDTYEAVQIAYDEKSEKHTSSSLLGHFKKAGTTPKRKMAELLNDAHPEWCFSTCEKRIANWLAVAEYALYIPMRESFAEKMA